MNPKRKKVLLLMVLCLTLLFLCGCADTVTNTVATLLSPDESYEKRSSDSGYRVTDSDRLYASGEDQVLTLYLTAGVGNEAEGTNHTWEEVNAQPLSFYEAQGIAPYACEAVVQFGDEIGPLAGAFGYGVLTPNATVRLRGAGASEQPQKSYRIDLKQGKGEWEKQKVIALNKHVSDPTRLRNRLAYELMQEIPTMFSARTWYVHLYVKDKTQPGDNLFHDYGLYTAVEQINGRYFKNRGLDSSGSLYKAVSFDWLPHAEIMAETDARFDLRAFEQYLEIKGNVDHSGLLTLLEAVNNDAVSTYQLIRTYFNEDNLYYWMAFHMLMGDRLAATTNYYLYSPQMQDKWYFLSWDNDGILNDAYERVKDANYDPSWNHGIFMFTQTRLFERILKDAQCRARLDEAVEDLMANHLTRQQIEEKTKALQEMSADLVYSLPDSAYQRVDRNEYERLILAMADEVEANYQAYKESLSEPWPFDILPPETAPGGMLTLRWEPAYVYADEEPVYSVELSRSPDFTSCFVKQQDYAETSYTLRLLPGQYFLRVRARYGDAWQDAMPYYLTEQNGTVYSTLCFYVLDDGSAEVLRYVEE